MQAWLPTVVLLPWLVPVIWLWRYRVRDGRVPPSMGDETALRLWTT